MTGRCRGLLSIFLCLNLQLLQFRAFGEPGCRAVKCVEAACRCVPVSIRRNLEFIPRALAQHSSPAIRTLAMVVNCCGLFFRLLSHLVCAESDVAVSVLSPSNSSR